MKYARVLDNTVVDTVELGDDAESRTVNGSLVLRPLIFGTVPTYNRVTQKLQERYVIEPSEVLVEYDVVPMFTSVDACKAAVMGLIDDWRDESLRQNVSAHGRSWQTDRRSRELLSSVITLAGAGVPLPPVWRDAANNNMVIESLSDLVTIAAAMAEATQVAYTKSWQLKAYVHSLPNVEESIAVLSSLTWDTQVPT